MFSTACLSSRARTGPQHPHQGHCPMNPVTLRGPICPCPRWNSGYTLVHPFRPLGKNSELLLVSDEEDAATWQRKSLSLHWASAQRAQTETEANHTRYVSPTGPAGPQAGHPRPWPSRVPRVICLQVTLCVENPRNSPAKPSDLITGPNKARDTEPGAENGCVSAHQQRAVWGGGHRQLRLRQRERGRRRG